MSQLKRVGDFTLLPPKSGVCQTCARDHSPELPHDQQSLYYQYAFYADNGRWPSWDDAMAHCTTEVQQLWREALAKVLKDRSEGGPRGGN